MPLIRLVQPHIEGFIPAPQSLLHISAELAMVAHHIHAVRWADGQIVLVEFTAEAWDDEAACHHCIEVGEELWDRYGIHHAFLV